MSKSMVSYTQMPECYDLPAQDCNCLITSATCVVLIRSSKYCTPCTHELMIRGLTVIIISPNTQLLLAVHYYVSVTVNLILFWRMNLRWKANGDDVQALWLDPCDHHQQAPRHKHGRGFVTRLSAPEKGMSATQCPSDRVISSSPPTTFWLATQGPSLTAGRWIASWKVRLLSVMHEAEETKKDHSYFGSFLLESTNRKQQTWSKPTR